MNDFDYEVMQRKRLARQAFHRKSGSKSKKCPMSTDHMTRKQWLERCGESVTYQLGKPMPWEEFKKMPVQIQKEYLLDMIRKYSTTASDLARLFGIGAPTVTKHCSSEEIGIKFSPGKKMPKDRHEEFERLFLNESEAEVEAPPPPAAEEPQDVVQAPLICQLDMSKAKPSSSGMEMTDFSMSFQGAINAEAVVNSIVAMLVPGAKVRLDVRCSVIA